MRIDHKATRWKYSEMSKQAIAAYCRTSPGRVTQVMNGQEKGQGGDAVGRVINRLRELGLLIEFDGVVNWPETRFRWDARKLVNIAAACDCSIDQVNQVIDGRPGRDEEVSARIANHLRELGILVEVPDIDQVDDSGWGQMRMAA